jgi:hypothetical protein
MRSSHPAGAGSRSSHLTWPRTLLRITTAQGAGAHCQTDAQRLACARSYDWPDDTLAASADRAGQRAITHRRRRTRRAGQYRNLPLPKE